MSSCIAKPGDMELPTWDNGLVVKGVIFNSASGSLDWFSLQITSLLSVLTIYAQGVIMIP
jgi:hypothetical protein